VTSRAETFDASERWWRAVDAWTRHDVQAVNAALGGLPTGLLVGAALSGITGLLDALEHQGIDTTTLLDAARTSTWPEDDEA
jgi:hypothetical protein